MTEPYYKGYLDSYETYLQHSPYVQALLSRLDKLTRDARSMLDIGAGTGIFSLAVPDTIEVTALEPSQTMQRAIHRHAQARGRTIRLIANDWEEATVTSHAYDIVLCANAIYQMHPLDEMLAKMVRTARQSVLIVMNARQRQGVYGRIRQALEEADIPCKKRPQSHTADDVRRTLNVLGIAYEEEIVSWQDIRPFSDQASALNAVADRFGISLADRERAEPIILPYLTEENGSYAICDETKMTFITVRKMGQYEEMTVR